MSNQLQITGGGKVRNLEGVITGTSGVLSSVPLGAANGVATLDSGGKVPVSQLPSSVVTYLGTWNAATNTPTLVNGTGDAGDMYICNVAGTVNFGAGPITFAVGDWVLYGSGTWQKSNGQNGTVTSVAASITGNAVGLTGSPITTAGTLAFAFAGTNLQYVNGAGNLTTFPILTGYVTAVSGTAPVVSSGGTTPAISMAAATGSVDGYLSATDFAIFSAKQSALTFSSPLVNTSGTISIPAATTSVNGYLASADFTTFNNKQNTITLTTTGTSGASTLVGATLNIPNYGSALTGYVPYTGATQDVDLGAFKLNAQSLHIKGTAGNGHLGLKHQSASATASANEVSLFADSLGDLSWQNANLYLSKFITSANTANRSYTFPNATGTVALTSDLTGYLTAVTATSPLSSSGGTTPNITIALATTSTNGYLSSTDWTTFNNKQTALNGTGFVKISGTTISYDNSTYALDSAVVHNTGAETINGLKTFSVYTTHEQGALIKHGINLYQAGYTGIGGSTLGLVIGLAGGGLASLNFNNTTNYTYTFPSATGTLALTSAIPANPVGGTGTTNYLPKFTGASTIGDSLVYDNGTSVIIGGTSGVVKLHVLDNGNTFSAHFSGNNQTNGVALGTSSGNDALIQGFTKTFSAYTNLNINKDGGNVLIGGAVTLTGALNGTTANFTGSSTFAQTSTSASITTKSQTGSAALLMQDNTAANKFEIGHYLGNYYIYSFANSTQALTLTGSGNLGLGVTPSAWAAGKSISVGSSAAFYGDGINYIWSAGIAENAYKDATVWKYVATGYSALRYEQLGDNGTHAWYNAASGTAGNAITFTQAMTLTAAGRLLLGTTTEGTYLLDVNGTGRFNRNDAANISLTIANAYINQGNLLNFQHNTAGTTTNGYIGHGGDNTGNFVILNNSITALSFARATGAATFSSSVTAGSSGQVFITGNAGTSSIGMRFTNSGGNSFIGLSNSGGTGYLSGTAYAFNIQTEGAQDLQLGTNNANRLIIHSTTGAATFSSSVSVNGAVALSKLNVVDGYVTVGSSANATTANTLLAGYGYILSSTTYGNVKITSSYNNGTNHAGLEFYTDNGTSTERMRITSGGELLIANSSGTHVTGYGTNRLVVNGGIYATSSIAAVVAANIDMFVFSNTGATYSKSCVVASIGDTGGTGSYFFYGQHSTNTTTVAALKIFSNGNIQNANNSYAGISDARLKENIKDATPKLDDLMKVKVRNYNLKGQSNKQIGVISQELEAIFPNMIEESTNMGENMKIKGVKYSVFVPMLIKAVQEQQQQINELKQLINK